MLTEIFYWLLNMSILGGITGSLILLIRRIKYIPVSFTFLLWVIPLIRFLLPVGISSRLSLMSLISRFTTRTVVIFEPDAAPSFVYSNFVMAAEDYFPLTLKTKLLETIFGIASIIWIIISIALLLTATLLYIFTKTEIKDAVPIGDNIYESDRITSPALYGILKPKIILPCGISTKQQEYILIHELVHARRHDNLWRFIAILTCCIHWFNPLAWICLNYFFEDMELFCDAKVLKKLDADEQKEYAGVLLSYTTSQSLFVTAFGGAKIRVRIEHILSYRRLTFVSLFFFTLLITAILVVLLTNATS